MDIANDMVMGQWTIKALDEVKEWLAALPVARKAKAEEFIDLLATRGETLPFPYSSHLGGKLRELRIQFGRDRERITYYPASGHRFVLLTVFRKTKDSETAEVGRARRAMEAHAASEKGPK